MDTNQELKNLQEQKKLAEYAGEDRVIPSEQVLKELEEEYRTSTFYHTGFKFLDDILGGLKRGQLVVISAPTGQGKTSFCQTLTERFTQKGEKCLWFSYEVGMVEFMEKMPEGGKMFYLPKQMKQNSLVWLRQRVIEGIAKYNTRIVFIDHLHYLLEMQKMAEAKSLSLLIGMMLRELKKLAIEQNVIVFLVTHIKKIQSEQPELEDLRDSSFVAQESDIVLMLWRETERIAGEKFLTNKVRVSVKKNRRTGKLGTVKMEYLNNQFHEIENVRQEAKIEKDWDIP